MCMSTAWSKCVCWCWSGDRSWSSSEGGHRTGPSCHSGSLSLVVYIYSYYYTYCSSSYLIHIYAFPLAPILFHWDIHICLSTYNYVCISLAMRGVCSSLMHVQNILPNSYSPPTALNIDFPLHPNVPLHA